MKLFYVSLLCASSLFAHFQTILVDKSVVEQGGSSKISIQYEFTHPFEQELMNMEKPKDAGVFLEGKKTSLLPTLQMVEKNKHKTWKSEFTFKEPGVRTSVSVNPLPQADAIP